MLVSSMRAVAHSPESIQRGNSERRSEVSVRAPTHCGLFELPPHVAGDGLRLLEQSYRSCPPFHGRTIHAPRDLQLTPSIDRLEGAKLAVNSAGVAELLNAHVHVSDRFRSDDVGARSPTNHSHVHRQSPLRLAELRHSDDLVCQLDDGTLSSTGIESRVRRVPRNAHLIVSHAFARSFERAPQSSGRLQHQDSLALFRELLSLGTRTLAPDFLIRHKPYAHRSRQNHLDDLKGLNGVQHQGNTRLHIEYPRPIEAALLDLARHFLQRAEFVDGIEVTQQQNRHSLRLTSSTSESDL